MNGQTSGNGTNGRPERALLALPTSADALREIADQEGEFFHLTGDSGEGMSLPLDGKLMAQRARNALGREHVRRGASRS